MRVRSLAILWCALSSACVSAGDTGDGHDALGGVVSAAVRTIVDGRTLGFCKLITDRANRTLLGCHVVGERATEIVQVAAGATSLYEPADMPYVRGIVTRAAGDEYRFLSLVMGIVESTPFQEKVTSRLE